MMHTTFVAHPDVEEMVAEAHAAGMQAGGEQAMQAVNRAVEDAGARGAAAGRSDRAYIAGARALVFGPDGKRRTVFGMKIKLTDRALLKRGRDKLIVETGMPPIYTIGFDDDGKAFLLDLEGKKVVPEVFAPAHPVSFSCQREHSRPLMPCALC